MRSDHYRPIKYVDIQKHTRDPHPVEPAIRIYCTQSMSVWSLQVRGPLGIGCNGSKPSDKASIIATARLGRVELIELHKVIGALLKEGE